MIWYAKQAEDRKFCWSRRGSLTVCMVLGAMRLLAAVKVEVEVNAEAEAARVLLPLFE